MFNSAIILPAHQILGIRDRMSHYRAHRGLYLGSDFNKRSTSSISTSTSSLWAAKLSRLHTVLTMQKTELLSDLSLEEVHLSWLEKVSHLLSNKSASAKSGRKTQHEFAQYVPTTSGNSKYSPPASPTSVSCRDHRNSVNLLKQKIEDLKKLDGWIDDSNVGSRKDTYDQNHRLLDISGTASNGADISWVAHSKFNRMISDDEARTQIGAYPGQTSRLHRPIHSNLVSQNKRRGTTQMFASTDEIHKGVSNQPRPILSKTVKFKPSLTSQVSNQAEDVQITEGYLTARSGSSAIRDGLLTERVTSNLQPHPRKVLKSELVISKFEQDEEARLSALGIRRDKLSLQPQSTSNQFIQVSKGTLSSVNSSKVTPRRTGVTGLSTFCWNGSRELLDLEGKLRPKEIEIKPHVTMKITHQQMLTGIGLNSNQGHLRGGAPMPVPNMSAESPPKLISRKKGSLEPSNLINQSLRQLKAVTQTPIRSTPSQSDTSFPNLAVTDLSNDQASGPRLIHLSTKNFTKNSGSDSKQTQPIAKKSSTDSKGPKHHPSLTSTTKTGLAEAESRIGKLVHMYLK